jgi:hypothetical protein
MPQLTARAVHVDQPLTNISVAYLQSAANFVSNQVFPTVPVSKQSDLYYEWARGSFFRDEAKQRAPNTEAAMGGAELSTSSYFAKPWSYKFPISDQVRANADSMVDLDMAAAAQVAQTLMIRKEKDWVANYFTSGVWSTEYTGVAATPGTDEVVQWSDPTSSDPIKDIRNASTDIQERTGFRPNTLVLPQRVFDALEDHPDIVDRIKYSGGVSPSQPAIVDVSALSRLFRVPRILIMGAVENTAAEGDALAMSFIGGKNALLAYVAPTPALMTPSAGYTFAWRGYLGQTNPFGMATKSRYVEPKESTEIEGSMAFDHKRVASDLAVFWGSIVQ